VNPEEQKTLNEVFSKIEYAIIPTLLELQKGQDNTNQHLATINGTCASLSKNDAVMAFRLTAVEKEATAENVRQVRDDTSMGVRQDKSDKRAERIDKRAIYNTAWRDYIIKILVPIFIIVVAAVLTRDIIPTFRP
jgi:mannose/fructose/N-acetylgalactosamine-specific phosphotransferase system component IIC